ncbi:hypothetical protein GGI59_003119 [Rhizobium lentis]|uniref:Uncharacterized protein n=1 Tax=Rhizobium lentis TaxID=1138194 RepID=A0A7W8UNX4_9HYPH|nr:hypothetical protein [Rhizobium lentis]
MQKNWTPGDPTRRTNLGDGAGDLVHHYDPTPPPASSRLAAHRSIYRVRPKHFGSERAPGASDPTPDRRIIRLRSAGHEYHSKRWKPDWKDDDFSHLHSLFRCCGGQETFKSPALMA